MSTKKPTLDAFLKKKKFDDCPICNLPAAVRKQIVGRPGETNLAVVSVWLKEIGYKITERQLSGHYRQGHERGKHSV